MPSHVQAPPQFCKYIGIPYKEYGYEADGCNCWGLVRLIAKENFGIQLPRHFETQYQGGPLVEETARKIRSLVQKHMDTGEWRRVDKYEADAGDLLILRVKGLPVHIGIAVSRTHMIHVLKGTEASCEAMLGLMWRNRIETVYRHKSRG